MCSSPASSSVTISMLMVKIEWLLEESAFIRVAPTALFDQPFCMIFSQSWTLWTGCIESPLWKKKKKNHHWSMLSLSMNLFCNIQFLQLFVIPERTNDYSMRNLFLSYLCMEMCNDHIYNWNKSDIFMYMTKGINIYDTLGSILWDMV